MGNQVDGGNVALLKNQNVGFHDTSLTSKVKNSKSSIQNQDAAPFRSVLGRSPTISSKQFKKNTMESAAKGGSL